MVWTFPLFVILNCARLTSHDHFGQRLAGADVVGGHAFVGPAVAGSEAGYHQFSSLGGLRPCGQTGSAHAAPLKLDGVAAVGQALQDQGVSGPELHLVGQGGGVRGACVRGTGVVFRVVGGRPTPVTVSTRPTHSPPPSACTPRCSRVRWWRCRCTAPSPAAPRRSESKPHCPPCVSTATGPGVWTRR